MRRDVYQGLLLLLLPLVACGEKDEDTGSGGGGDSGTDTTATAGTACLSVEDDATCPASEAVDVSALVPVNCGAQIVSVTGEGTAGTDPTGWGDTSTAWCCYPVLEHNDSGCDYGRPFLLEGVPQHADAGPRPGWAEGAVPQVDDLPPEARTALAAAWLDAALDEHAAVAAFARLALELLAFGAPAALVGRTTAAATEEVQHARLGFRLASAYAGHPVGPTGFPLGEQLPLTRDLAAFAAATVREGCIGETLTTLLALDCLAQTTDPAVRATLQQITHDEQGHAQLAWATVRWALDVGGPEVRAAVAAAFASLERGSVPLPERLAAGPHTALLVAHGLPDARMARTALDRGVREVILPAARAMLGLTGGTVLAAASPDAAV